MRNLHTEKKQSNKKRHGHGSVGFILLTLFFCFIICAGSTGFEATLYASGIDATTEVMTDDTSSTTSSGSKKVTVKNSQFDIEISYGLDGYALYDVSLPVSVKVTSNKDFTGEIAVRPVSDSASYSSYTTEYVQDVSLAAGTENTADFLLSTSADVIKIQIRDTDGKVIYEEKDTLTLKNRGSSLAVGILSDDYSGISYFDGVTASIGSYSGLTTILELDSDTFPEEEAALGIVNYIIIDNYDTSKLSDRQYSALKKWVNDGGILICALGANYQNVLHIFDDDFVTGSFDGISKKDIVFTDEIDLNGNDMSMEISDVDVIDFSYDDSTELSDLSNGNTAFTRRIGSGAVIMLGYSLCSDELSGSQMRKDIAEAVINKTAVSGETENVLNYSYFNNYDYYTGSSIAENYFSADQPDLKFYLILFAVYMIFVGPVLYLVLKKLGKREYMWAGIPVLALLFTVIVLISGNSIKIKKPIVSTISVIDIGDETATEKVFAEIVCPESKDYDINLIDDYYDLNTYDGYSSNYYYYDTDEEADLTLSVKNTTDGTSLKLYNDSIFGTACISVSRLRENDIGSIDCDITLYSDGMEGTVTNNTNYDFSSMMLTEGNSYLILEEVKAGETVKITRDMFISSSNLWIVLSNFYSYDYNDDLSYQSYYINDYTYSCLNCGSESGHCYIWGITDYHENITDSEVNSYGGSVFYTDFYESYADHIGFYTSDINEYISSSEGDFSSGDYCYLYDDSILVRYTFSDEIVKLTNVSQASGETFDDYSGCYYSEVYALNYTTNTYEQIFTDGNVLEEKDLRNYLSGNKITLKYTGMNTIMPTISAEGEE